MLNHPGTEDQAPSSSRLVLPAPPDETPRSSPFPPKPRVEPGQLIRRQTSPVPTELLPKILYYWRKDPAYKVFMIAIALVVLAAIVFASLGSAALLGKSTSSNYTTNPPTSVAPKGTVDLRPTFTKPNGGSGSGQTSQPPAQGTTTIINVTPTAGATVQPTQPGQGGTLTLAITSYPPTVSSGTRVSITISTNQPGVTVSLEVRSNAQPRNSIAGSATTDANGNATIGWFVFFLSTNHKVTATLTAIAQDQTGQQVASNPVTVQVIVQRMG